MYSRRFYAPILLVFLIAGCSATDVESVDVLAREKHFAVHQLVHEGLYTQDCGYEQVERMLRIGMLPPCMWDDTYASLKPWRILTASTRVSAKQANPPRTPTLTELPGLQTLVISIPRFPHDGAELGMWKLWYTDLMDSFAHSPLPRMLVYDIRGNQGGVLAMLSLRCLHEELGDKPLYVSTKLTGRYVLTESYCREELGIRPIFKDVPLTVIVIDSHTYSAASIWAKAMRAHVPNVLLVGEQAQSKEHCQTYIDVTAAGTLMRLSLTTCTLEVPGVDLSTPVVPDIATPVPDISLLHRIAERI